MAYTITSQCISCDRCLSVCPTNAIKVTDGKHWIDSTLCTKCVGSTYSVPQCVAGCPTYDGCIEQPSDYWESWFMTYNRLVGKLTKKQDYWERWFDTYSQKFAGVLQSQRDRNLTLTSTPAN